MLVVAIPGQEPEVVRPVFGNPDAVEPPPARLEERVVLERLPVS